MTPSVAFEAAAYGSAGTPLVQSTLRGILGRTRLTREIRERAGITASVTWAAGVVENCTDAGKLLSAVAAEVRAMLADYRVPFDTPLVNAATADGLDLLGVDFDRLPFRNRTRNFLDRHIPEPISWIRAATVEDVLDIRYAGPTVAVELGTVTETAVRDARVAARRTRRQLQRLSPLPGWAAHFSGEDPRVADLLSGDRTAKELMQDPAGRLQVLGAVEELFDRAAAIAELSLDDQLDGLLAQLILARPPIRSLLDKPRRRAIAARLGLAAEDPPTLDAVGRRLGVTRERVRQMETVVAKKLHGLRHEPYLPALDHAIAVVESVAPAPERIAADALQDDGITAARWTGAALSRAARLMGRQLDVVVADGWILPPEMPHPDRLVGLVSAQTSTYGMTTPAAVSDTAENDGLNFGSVDVVRSLLDAYPNLGWSHSRDWVWDPSSYNSALAAARRMLSVTPGIEVNRLREGLRRAQAGRQRDVIPPADALRDLLVVSPPFRVEGDVVTCTEHLDYRRELGEVHARFVDLFLDAPYGLLDRVSINAAAREAGLSLGTANTWSSQSPVIELYPPNVYGLRGRDVTPGVLDAVRSSARQRLKSIPAAVRWAWAADGSLILALRVRGDFWVSGVTIWPAPVRKLLGDRRITMASSDGHTFTIASSTATHFNWGWGSFLRATNLSPGDVIRVRINLADNTGIAEHGDDRLLSVDGL